jgi:hypothetical protein
MKFAHESKQLPMMNREFTGIAYRVQQVSAGLSKKRSKSLNKAK